ncbi:MAG: PEP-CTERM sorting domain-containing protein [Opitutae bacterium]|nr:PEP-CTERM sorting domain-containing protein [Opitutae bacterium]
MSITKALLPIIAVAGIVPAQAATDSLLPSDIADATRISIPNSDSDHDSWINALGSSSVTAASVATDCALRMNETGWYWGLSNAQDAFSTDFSSDDDTSFSFHGRKNYGGEFVCAVVDLSDLIGTDDEVDNFSISFDFDGQSSASFSIYTLSSDGTATELYKNTSIGTGLSFEFSEAETYSTLTANEKLVFIWNDNSSGSLNSVSNLSSSYSVVAVVPEPSAFGLLAGLGAIALVATRKRNRSSRNRTRC